MNLGKQWYNIIVYVDLLYLQSLIKSPAIVLRRKKKYIAIFFEKKLNSSIPLYICAAVDLFGLVLTAQVAIKKDIHKYLSKEDTAK